MSNTLRNAGITRSEISRLFAKDDPLQRLARSIELVAAVAQIPPSTITGAGGAAEVVRARHFAIYLAHHGEGISQGSIARMMDLDPKTITYALERVERDLATLRAVGS